MTKILHISDTHLGLSLYGSAVREQGFEDTFSEALRIAITREFDAVVHTGDFTHGQKPDETLPESAWNALRKLADADIPFYFILGNHDFTENNSPQQWVQEIHKNELGQRLTLSPTRVGKVSLYGSDYKPPAEWSDHSFQFGQPPAQTTPILCLHQSIAPVAPGDDILGLDDILSSKPFEFGAILLGHSHYTQGAVVDGTPVWYAGSTDRTTRGYADDPTVALEVRIDDSITINPINLRTQRFETYTLVPGTDVTEAQIRATLNRCEFSNLVVTLFLTGELKSFSDNIKAFVTEQGVVDERILTADRLCLTPGVYRGSPDDLELWNPDTPMVDWVDEELTIQNSTNPEEGLSVNEREGPRITDRMLEDLSAELDAPIRDLEAHFENLRSYDVMVHKALQTISDFHLDKSDSIFELDGIGILRGHFLFHSGYKTVADIRLASDEELLAVKFIGDNTIDEIRDGISSLGESALDETGTFERNEHDAVASRTVHPNTTTVSETSEKAHSSDRDEDMTESKEPSCPYTFDQAAFEDQAETPRTITVKTTGSDDVWQCPHTAQSDSDLCIFHTPPCEKNDEDASEAFLSAISKTAESSREKEFVGAKFGNLDLSDRVIDPDDNYPIDLSHAEIEGELQLNETTLTNKFRLSHSDLDNGLSAEKSNLIGGIECYGCKFDSPVNFSKARLGKYPLFGHSAFCKGVTFNRAEFPDGVSFTGVTFESYMKFIHVECAGQAMFMGTRFQYRAQFNSAVFRDRVVFCAAQFDLNESRDYQPMFIDVTFEDHAIFGVTDQFSNVPAAAFVQEPEFENATIRGPLECVETTMIDGASFAGAIFRDKVRIKNGVVAGRLDFSEASITDSLIVAPHDTGSSPICTSLVDAEVTRGRIVQPDCLGQNGREQDKNGTRNYGILVDCFRATIGNVDFISGDGYPADLSWVRFLQTKFENFDFIEYRQHLEPNWELHTVEDPDKICTQTDPSPLDLELTYLRAKSGANEIGDSRSAAGFFKREMRFRRKGYREKIKHQDTLRSRLTSKWKYRSNWVLDLLCRYGESPKQTLIWTSIFVLACAVLYAVGFSILSEVPYPETGWPLAVQYLLISGESFVAFIGTPAANVGAWPLRALSAFQGFTGAFMIALFLFTLTRYIHR